MGATNHMTGCRSAFSDLDHNIHSTIKFGDGAVVKIEGIGTILFNDKNREHQAFTGVYFIPRLTTNIINVGQLDEIGYQTLIEGGVMGIRDVEHNLSRYIIQLIGCMCWRSRLLFQCAWQCGDQGVSGCGTRASNTSTSRRCTSSRGMTWCAVYRWWSRWIRFVADAWLASIVGHPSLIKQSMGRIELWS
jgi:hypothetical protein